MSYMVLEYVHLDGTRVEERVIGQGAKGMVLMQGQYALKIPLLTRILQIDGVPVESGRLTPQEGDYDERPDLIAAIQDEKAIYRRLGDHPGIVRCYDLSSADHSIRMDLMKNGDLRHYLAEIRPEKKTQLDWLSKMARTTAYIHEHRIIIADICLDNLLLDDDLSIKFIDFGESTIMPLDWNLDRPGDLGYLLLNDIGQFGAAMFEIVTGQKCRFDLMQDWKEPGDPFTWPRRDSLPSTSGAWLGQIIEQCWTQGITSAKDLAEQLDNERVPTMQ